MEIIVQLTEEIARELAKGASSAKTRPILDAARELQITLRPQHPGTEDGHLVRYFSAKAQASEEAKILARLRGVPGVTAAYSKPSASLP
jgi:hypothetical protein